jgi:MYXO-CTERM domain-containing protein
LAEHAGKLWMCANISPNLDGIWTLKDDASGVDKVMSFEAVTAPVACSDSAARALCEIPWHDFNLELHPTADDAGSADAGALDAATAKPDGALEEEEDAEQDAERDADGEDEAQVTPPRHGSRCQFGATADVVEGGWALCSLLGLLAWRRRRTG